jgi:hypothetical protein
MAANAATPCPACGTPGSEAFCSHCGTPRAGARCAGCGTPLAPQARFCSSCGRSVGAAAGAPSRDRLPWLIAGTALVGMLAAILFGLTRERPTVAAAEPEGMPAAAATGAPEAPPDISNMSPQERFNRLYNRIMQAAQSGDEATVTRFSPMALMAYAQLDTIDADAMFHAALIKMHTSDVDGARALGDSILARRPGNLLGYIVQGTVARFRKDQRSLNGAYDGFLKRYDAEMKAGRPEYEEHRTSVESFRAAAREARKGASGS